MPIRFPPPASPTGFDGDGVDVSNASPDNPVEIVPGVEITDPRLGRLPDLDPRNRQFPMAAVLQQAAKQYRPRSYTWSVEAHLDQGNEPSCVGFAWAHELLARPAVIPKDAKFASWLYRTAQRYDQWAGESYAGTSVLAGARVVQKQPPAMSEGRGLIGEYRWIFGDLNEVIRTVGYFGPVIFGTWWYEGMFDPGSDGFVRPTGYRAGGHAYLIKGVNLSKKALRIHNSWGAGWGEDGDAWLSFDDTVRLLNETGECCVPVRRYTIDGD